MLDAPAASAGWVYSLFGLATHAYELGHASSRRGAIASHSAPLVYGVMVTQLSEVKKTLFFALKGNMWVRIPHRAYFSWLPCIVAKRCMAATVLGTEQGNEGVEERTFVIDLKWAN